MSRSTRDKHKSRIQKFPLSEDICGVTVTEISVGKKGKTEYLKIIFRKGEYNLTHFVTRPSVEFLRKYSSSEQELKMKLKQEKEATRDWIETFFAVFLTSEQMIEARTKATNYITYCEALKEFAEQNNYKNKQLCIKTVPHRKRMVTMPKYGDFIKLQNDDSIFLEWSKWEKKQISKNVN